MGCKRPRAPGTEQLLLSLALPSHVILFSRLHPGDARFNRVKFHCMKVTRLQNTERWCWSFWQAAPRALENKQLRRFTYVPRRQQTHFAWPGLEGEAETARIACSAPSPHLFLIDYTLSQHLVWSPTCSPQHCLLIPYVGRLNFNCTLLC